MTNSVIQLVSKKCRARASCQFFEDKDWKDRSAVLEAAGFINVAHATWHEVTPDIAQGILTAALSKDLCYDVRRMDEDSASALAQKFLGQFQGRPRFFTNSATPYHMRESAWQFDPITGHVVDTGIVVRIDGYIAGILWIGDDD